MMDIALPSKNGGLGLIWFRRQNRTATDAVGCEARTDII